MIRFHKKQLVAVFVFVLLWVFQVAACAEESTPADGYRYEVLFASGINSENAEDADGARTLGQDGISFGPYVDLMQGAYRVYVTGENLSAMAYDVVSDSGNFAHSIYNPALSETELTYGFVLSEATPRMEVRFFNYGEEPVILTSCIIEEVDPTELMQFSVSFDNNENLENGEDNDGVRTINQDGISCGPYVDMLPGAYQVRVTGENLTGMTYDVVSDSGNTAYVMYGQKLSDTELIYGFVLSEATPRMEVRFANPNAEPVVLSACEIEAMDVAQLMQFATTFDDNVNLTNGEDVDGVRHLYEGGLSYGPYINLMPGVYEVTITGTNLEWAVPRFTDQYGANAHALYNLQATPTYVSYKVQLDAPIQAAESTLYNPIPETMTIENVTIRLQQ